MNEQLDFIGKTHTLEQLPSAKVRPKDKVGVHAWTNFYASYSETFVESAVKTLKVKETDVVLDPFVGAGTTLIAAKKMGYQSIGFDIDPFSCFLSKAKLSQAIDHKKINKLLRKTNSSIVSATFSQEALQLFDEECLQYATAVFNRIKKNIGRSSNFIHELLSDTDNKYDSEIVALTALCIGASESAKLMQGSNPTWYRKADVGEKDNLQALVNSTQIVLTKMLKDIDEASYSTASSTVYNLDIRDANNPKYHQIANVIITSPPYLTRIDYAMKHFPNLAIISGLIEFDFTELRKKMIGTPKIVDKGIVNAEWGELCTEVINKIKHHESYASESYYVWTYYQYFKSLYETFIRFKKLLKIDGKGLIILQDSFYKDVHIPLSDIAVEMLQLMGFEAMVVVRDLVKQNMKQLNPSHQKKKITKKASEDVIHFRLKK